MRKELQRSFRSEDQKKKIETNRQTEIPICPICNKGHIQIIEINVGKLLRILKCETCGNEERIRSE